MVRAEGTQAILPATLDRWFTPAFRTTAPARVKAVADGFQGIDRNGYALACEAIGRMDLRPVLKEITAPTTVIAGAEDPATPLAMAEVLRDAIPDAGLRVLSPAAHLLAVEQPVKVVSELHRKIAALQGG